jgi:hypothetical protein
MQIRGCLRTSKWLTIVCVFFENTFVPSCQQVQNKLLTTCNDLVDIIRLVARLFQQVRYNDVTTLSRQPCYIMTVSDLLEQTCNKSDNAKKVVPSF